MNALLVLMGLLLLSYVGSFLVSGRTIRGFGLPSGAEYVLLGFVLGPYVLGLLERSLLATFDPIADVALGWLALLIGLDFGIHEGHRVRAQRLFGGALVSLFTGGLVAAVVWVVLGKVTPLVGVDRGMLAGGAGAACAETTRHAIRWVVERHRASGPVSDLVAELAESDDIVPLLAVALLFGVQGGIALPFTLRVPGFDVWGWGTATLLLGVVLGMMAALLLGRDFRRSESWGVLVGVSLLCIGTTARLGLSSISAMFAMGATIAALSRHRVAIRELVAPTERPVLHPALLLAGAHVELRGVALPFIVLFAIAARTIAKSLVGVAIKAASRPARAAGPTLGLGLLSSGALAMTIGLAFALRFPGLIGDSVLATAATATLLGEFVGPACLRVALKQAGEVDALSDPPPDDGTSKEAVAS